VREFWQRTGLPFAQQAIAQAEQGISSLLQAPVGLLTKLFQCVKVHLENAPFLFVLSGTLLHQAICCNSGLPEFTFV
jgi:hypothetical protein